MSKNSVRPIKNEWYLHLSYWRFRLTSVVNGGVHKQQKTLYFIPQVSGRYLLVHWRERHALWWSHCFSPSAWLVRCHEMQNVPRVQWNVNHAYLHRWQLIYAYISQFCCQARDVAERITSIYAELIALCAASTAVSNPNVLSISNMSLSIVLGTQTIDTCNFLLRHCNKNFAKIQCQMDSQASTFAIFIQNYKSNAAWVKFSYQFITMNSD